MREAVLQRMIAEQKGPVLPPPQKRRAIRRHAGLTQQQLSLVVGCSDVSVYLWENGYETPSPKSARRYLKVLERLASLPPGRPMRKDRARRKP